MGFVTDYRELLSEEVKSEKERKRISFLYHFYVFKEFIKNSKDTDLDFLRIENGLYELMRYEKSLE